ncbi:MFS transporter, partial [Pseudotabrizicola sp.]
FVSAIYVGGLVLQYPIGWLSDRIDRRIVVLWLAVLGAVVLMIPVIFDPPFAVLVGVAAVCGGVSNPLYSLLLAYVNDYLDKSDMAAASAGLMFINGLGAISGPVITGWMMEEIGSSGFFLFMGILFAILAAYAGWRMTQRRETPEVTSGYTPVSPTASIVAVETAALVEAEDARQGKARN